MYRSLLATLVNWRASVSRLPLVIRGARQVGKTYVVREFGKQYFANYVEINFEQQPEIKPCFSRLNPKEILAKLEIVLGIEINSSNTLIFLDEIQDCVDALKSLRYFKEQLPECYIISAGSLLEFALNEFASSFPVGRVEFYYLHPMSFYEFLYARNKKLLDFLSEIKLDAVIEQDIHLQALGLVRQYSILGGFPAIINKYLETNSYAAGRSLQNSILTAIYNDFGKYAKHTEREYLQQVLTKAPQLLGMHIKYTNINPELRSYVLKRAIKLLNLAGIMYPVTLTLANGIPLASKADQRFKLILLDIGIYHAFARTDPDAFLNNNLIMINNGQLAEQFVGQELIAYEEYYQQPAIYFWLCDHKNSQAEVDYVGIYDNKIVPIEVKSGTTGRLKSLQIFLGQKKILLGVRISEKELSLDKNVLSVPFYLIFKLTDLVRQAYIVLSKE